MCWIKLSRGGGGVRVMGQELLSRPLADILHGSRLVFNNKNHSTLQFCISHCGTVLVVWDYKWPRSTPTSSRGEGSSLLHHKMKSSWKVPFSKKKRQYQNEIQTALASMCKAATQDLQYCEKMIFCAKDQFLIVAWLTSQVIIGTQSMSDFPAVFNLKLWKNCSFINMYCLVKVANTSSSITQIVPGKYFLLENSGVRTDWTL